MTLGLSLFAFTTLHVVISLIGICHRARGRRGAGVPEARFPEGAGADPIRPPFVVVQIAMLALFLAAGFLALRRFHPDGGVRPAAV